MTRKTSALLQERVGSLNAFDLSDDQKTSHVLSSVNDRKRIGRGVPNVAAVADPATGYAVRVAGRDMVIDGRSAVAPLMAGLIASISAQRGKSVGFIHPIIYANPNVFRDTTQGNNSTTGNRGYRWLGCLYGFECS